VLPLAAKFPPPCYCSAAASVPVHCALWFEDDGSSALILIIRDKDIVMLWAMEGGRKYLLYSRRHGSSFLLSLTGGLKRLAVGDVCMSKT